MLGYFIIAGIFSVVGMIVSTRLRGKFNYYGKVGLRNGMSGAEIAEAMLRHYGVQNVRITEGQGFLSDHYNPANKTVNLSPEVYHGRSVAAAAVAAHECGHAIQHADAYAMLQVRSALVPVVSIAANLQQYLLLFALGAFGIQGGQTLLLITIIVFGITTLFSLVTLPVEFDASRRALVWLDQSGVTRGEEHKGAKDALWWAAMTYVAAALSSLVTLLYLILRMNNNN